METFNENAYGQQNLSAANEKIKSDEVVAVNVEEIIGIIKAKGFIFKKVY